MALTKVSGDILDTGIVIAGVTTSTNFKTGTSNLHNSGIEIAGINVLGANTPIGAGVTIYNSGGADFTGVVTATKFVGQADISGGSITATTGTFSGNVSIGGTLTYEDVTNIDSVGIVTAREGVFIPDNKELKIGNTAGTPDLKIYHSSSNNNSYIEESGSGYLIAKSNRFEVTNAAGTEALINAVQDTGVSLYDGTNTVRLETTSTGATVTGDFVFGANAKAKLFENGVQSGVQATNSGSSAHLMTHDGNEDIHLDPSGYIKFEVAGTERLRITSGGKTLIHGGGATGANDTATILENGNTLNIHGTSSSDGISVVRYSANYGAYGINIGKSRNNTFGTNTLVQDGNELGHISFYGADGTDFEMAAQITGLVDGDPATGGDGTDMPGALSFRTTPEGSDSPTERLRITAAGNLKIPDNAKIELGGAQTGGGDLYIQHAPAGSGSDTIHSNSAYLYINSDALRLNSKTSGWNYLRGDKSDGVVKLYKSNSAKLSTSDTGITVTGEVAATQDYPDYRPTLDFNFAAVKKLDSRFRYYRLGGASYIDENGLVKFVSENQPRFDHDPVTREPKGLLIEQTRTNLLRYSHGDGFKSQGHMNDYTVGWVQQDTTNSTITPNAALGPDGTMSALKYTLNATSGRRLDYEEVDLDNSTTYCWSWWMKRMASNAVWSFQFVSGTSPTGDQILIDGVAASGQTTTYTPPDDKWHRVTWKFTTQANADEQDLGGYDSSGGTGDRWLLWGAQLEAGAFPTSLIPTRGNKATRGSEEIHMGSDRDGSSALDRTILNIFDDHEGTIVAEWETQESETNQNLISFHKDLSSAERVEIRATGSSTSNVRAEIVTGGSSTASIQVAHGGLQKNTKAAFGFQKDNYSLSVNGSAVSSDTSGNMPSDINSLMIGKGTWGTYFDGHLKRFMYYPKNLPDSQLITLTS